MQQFKPLDFTELCLDGQVNIITVKEAVKASKTPYILLTASVIAFAGIIAYYRGLLVRKERELQKHLS